MIYICSLEEMAGHVRALRPGRLVSLLAPEEQPPTPPEIRAELHLRVGLHDITQPVEGMLAPEAHHLAELVDFLRDAGPDESLLLHCMAGVSRSPAAALVALALANPGREAEAAERLRRVAPHAQPNRRMIALADALLGLEGRLVAAREAMGPADLLLAGPLVRLPRVF